MATESATISLTDAPVEQAVASDNSLVAFGAGGGGVVVTYSKRARDSNGTAPAPPGSYVYWSTTDPNGVYPLAPPFGGPLVEDVVLSES